MVFMVALFENLIAIVVQWDLQLGRDAYTRDAFILRFVQFTIDVCNEPRNSEPNDDGKTQPTVNIDQCIVEDGRHYE